ncbi:hypothetical protein JQK87_25910 [Streptomyces sp. G44]|uniref:hypothetical protein n=1 Tax=Streptomyces sp. G44 TaxID=2807632 RepID=UPI001960F6EE|nr:hypothetical protein [Streptomyces sp. G44]MBM7171776.1 hypothetical protein [Streptomyces sp. G44]
MTSPTENGGPAPDRSLTDEEPAEHRRFAAHLAALRSVAAADEAELVAAVLRDEDTTMARSAVVRHIDRRAALLLTDVRFPAWAHTLAAVVAGDDFLVRRLREWTLLSALASGGPWDRDELAGASDWCQRTAVTEQVPASPEALGWLAEHGRTRRVRNAAAALLRASGPRGPAPTRHGGKASNPAPGTPPPAA